MKLKNKLITSLEAFKLNFDFREVWNKTTILQRDLSPYYIDYIDDEIALYNAICNPASYRITGGMMFDSRGQQLFGFEPLDDDEKRILESIKAENKVLVAAITRLAQKKITDDIRRFFLPQTTKPDNGHEWMLECGQNMQMVQKPSGRTNLHTVLIEVRADVDNEVPPAKIGDYSLKSGKCTYGVCCGNGLVAVCPNEAKNIKYHLCFEKNEEGVVLTVKERSSGNTAVVYKNARYFALVGDENFVVLDGLTVRTFQNQDLDQRLRTQVKKAFVPVMVECDGTLIKVTYENGREEKIEI